MKFICDFIWFSLLFFLYFLLNPEMGDKRYQKKKTMNNIKKFLNMDELADYTGMSKSFLYKRVSKKTIPFVKLGERRTVFVTEEIDKWVLRGGQMGLDLPELPKF